MNSDDEEATVCMGECLTPEVISALVAEATKQTMIQVCQRCDNGGNCNDDQGCSITPEFITEMRRAARTLETISRVYEGCGNWTADLLRYEASYLEKHQ